MLAYGLTSGRSHRSTRASRPLKASDWSLSGPPGPSGRDPSGKARLSCGVRAENVRWHLSGHGPAPFAPNLGPSWPQIGRQSAETALRALAAPPGPMKYERKSPMPSIKPWTRSLFPPLRLPGGLIGHQTCPKRLLKAPVAGKVATRGHETVGEKLAKKRAQAPDGLKTSGPSGWAPKRLEKQIARISPG